MKNAIIALCLATIFALPAAADDFVLRAKYPKVTPISTEQLAEDYAATLIVDVRSDIEFDVIHIAKAAHLPIALGNFLAALEQLRPKNGTTPIAFYCNGTTCAKSYKAAEEAMAAGFANVLVYDAGIPEWVARFPDRTTLMGKTPAPPEKLLSTEAFQARKIPYGEFARRAAEPGSLVIDIREPFQRAQNPELPQNRLLTLPGVRSIPSDRMVKLLQKGEFKGKTLLITDAVGKQVRWLQYYLEDYGYSDYFFLDRGVLAAADAGAVR